MKIAGGYMIFKRKIKSLYLILLVTALLMAGCGSTTNNSEAGNTGVFVDATISLTDAGTTVAGQIDVVQDICDAIVIPPKYEDFFDALGDVTFDTTSILPDNNDTTLYIDSYRVDYLPLPSPDSSGNMLMPPALNSVSWNKTIILPSNGSVSATIVTVPVATKLEFYNKGFLSTAPQGFYTVRVTFFGKSISGQSFTIVVDGDALFTDYNNC